MNDVIDLDGTMVQALALGHDGSQTDGTDWSLDRTDMPLLIRQIGTLTVNWVDDLNYTQFVVNGIPVDPASIEPVDYSGHTTLVASGWEDVARDSDGKWTSGIGGIGVEATTPPPQTPGQISMWTPGQVAGQKAAATKKAKAAHAAEIAKMADMLVKAKADKEAADALSVHAQADQTMTNALALIAKGSGSYPSENTILNATPAIVDQYLHVALGDSYAKKVPDNYGPIERAKVAVAVSNQHLADTKLLNSIGYLTDRPAIAMEARRAVLRETGERKPTGGPGSGQAVHTFYGEDTIRAMTREKQAAILVHHTAGSYTMAQALELSPETLADKAVTVDADYKAKIADLTAYGFKYGGLVHTNMSEVPHSLAGAMYVGYGNSKGLSPLAVAQVSKPLTNSSTSLGKPANWASMSPGKKAAWTKKYNLGQVGQAATAAVAAMQPANWASMSPGKKAAWTKANNLGKVTASYYSDGSPVDTSKPAISKNGTVYTSTIPLGDHELETHQGTYNAGQAAAKYVSSKIPDDSVHTPHHQLSQVQAQMTKAQKAAWTSYYGGGYHAMNDCGKYGKGCTEHIKAKIAALQSSIQQFGTPTPTRLFRGKHSGPMKDLTFKVGQEFAEDGFGSWSTSRDFSSSWGNIGGSGNAVFYNLLNSHGARSVPSASGESERIMPRGTRYKVIAIHDFVSASGGVQRILDVDLVYAPVG